MALFLIGFSQLHMTLSNLKMPGIVSGTDMNQPDPAPKLGSAKTAMPHGHSHATTELRPQGSSPTSLVLKHLMLA